MYNLEEKLQRVFEGVRYELESEPNPSRRQLDLLDGLEGDIAEVVSEYTSYMAKFKENVENLIRENEQLKNNKPLTIKCDKRINEKM